MCRDFESCLPRAFSCSSSSISSSNLLLISDTSFGVARCKSRSILFLAISFFLACLRAASVGFIALPPFVVFAIVAEAHGEHEPPDPRCAAYAQSLDARFVHVVIELQEQMEQAAKVAGKTLLWLHALEGPPPCAAIKSLSSKKLLVECWSTRIAVSRFRDKETSQCHKCPLWSLDERCFLFTLMRISERHPQVHESHVRSRARSQNCSDRFK
jgi:hypothetical protein